MHPYVQILGILMHLMQLFVQISHMWSTENAALALFFGLFIFEKPVGGLESVQHLQA